MKRFLCSALIILCSGTSSLADDVYGCIINETPVPYHGTISSDARQFRFDVQGEYIWCNRIPEGSYLVQSTDGKLNHKFTASWQTRIGLVGDETLHWLVKIKEQEK